MINERGEQCVGFNQKHTRYKDVNKGGELTFKKGYTDIKGAQFFQTYFQFHQDCSTYNLSGVHESDFVTDLIQSFNNKCKNNPKCQIPYDYTKLNQKCLKEVIKRA